MATRNIGLDHLGGIYFYRIHDLKLHFLCNGYGRLKGYINDVFLDCPNDYFNRGPRSSALKFWIDASPIKIIGHEVSELAKNGLKINKERYSSKHSRVQVFMLEFDDKTIATELPIWLKNNEIKDYKKIFDTDETLSGHIDLLRIESNDIWIWDYKPNADKEIYAATQVYLYALMLSRRTGISLDKFRCGYFDDKSAYVFEPKEDSIKVNSSLHEFTK